jgi:peptidoglycan hydrolase FlgJ
VEHDMTIAPVANDLITDVINAADPVAQRHAASRLERMTPAQQAEFTAALKSEFNAGHAQPASMPADTSVPTTPVIRQSEGSYGVYRKFEAFVLQMFVEAMLPKDAEQVFGKGSAGNIWRSMMAEQIGNEMAKGKGIGIAQQLAKSRPVATPGTDA